LSLRCLSRVAMNGVNDGYGHAQRRFTIFITSWMTITQKFGRFSSGLFIFERAK